MILGKPSTFLFLIAFATTVAAIDCTNEKDFEAARGFGIFLTIFGVLLIAFGVVVIIYDVKSSKEYSHPFDKKTGQHSPSLIRKNVRLKEHSTDGDTVANVYSEENNLWL